MVATMDNKFTEYAAIGSILVDERCLPRVQAILPSPEAFAYEPCQKAYAAILELAGEGKEIDPVTVCNRAQLPEEYAREWMQIMPTCEHAEEYARLVAEGHRRRQLQQLGQKLQLDALTADPDQLLEQTHRALERLTQPMAAAHSPMDSLQAFLQFRSDVNGGKRKALKVGFPGLDAVIGGFARGGLYVLAARPGVGKSALGIALADMLAKENRVLYVSLEMTEEELNARRVAAFSDACCSFGKLLFDTTTEQEDAAVLKACSDLYQRKLSLCAAATMTVAQLGIQARKVGAEVVMVDYLGLLSAGDGKLSEYERITQISGDLKRLAKRLGCVVIALCQLNRESASLPSAEQLPKLSQLRSSGAIEQDADGVLLLHRPDYGKRNVDPAAPQKFFVEVAKNRHGRTGTVELTWMAPVNRFEDRSGRWTVKSWI